MLTSSHAAHEFSDGASGVLHPKRCNNGRYPRLKTHPGGYAHHYQFLLPNFPPFQAAVGLIGVTAVPDIYFSRLNPFELVQKKGSPITLITMHSAGFRASKPKMLRQPWRFCGGWGIWVPEGAFCSQCRGMPSFPTHSHVACRLLVCCFILSFRTQLSGLLQSSAHRKRV